MRSVLNAFNPWSRMTGKRIFVHSFKRSYAFSIWIHSSVANHRETSVIFRIDVPFKTIIFGFQAHYYLPSGANFKVYRLLKRTLWLQPDTERLVDKSSSQCKFLFKIMFLTQSTLVLILGSLVKYKFEVIKSFRATWAIPKLIFYLYFVGEIGFQM